MLPQGPYSSSSSTLHPRYARPASVPVAVIETFEVSEDSSIDENEHDHNFNYDDCIRRSAVGTTSTSTNNIGTRKQRTNKSKRSNVRNNSSDISSPSPRSSMRRTVSQSQSLRSDHCTRPSKMQRSASLPEGNGKNRIMDGHTRTTSHYDDCTMTRHHDTNHRNHNDNHQVSMESTIARGGVACPFPWKLHDMLEFCCSTTSSSSAMNYDTSSQSQIVTWNETGTAFAVLNAKVFVQTILPRFFAQTKYASFQRQLNLYGFTREALPTTCVATNKNGTARTKNISYYSHPHFVRGERDLVRFMVRCKVKGTGKKRHDSVDDDHMDTEEQHHHFDCNKISSEDDDDDYEDEDEDDEDNGTKHDTREVSHNSDDHDDDELHFYDESTADRHGTILNDVCSDTEPNKDMLVLNDGDLAFFEGSPFRFLNSHHIDEFDSTLPTSDVTDVPLMMLPTTQIQLASSDGRENDYLSIGSNSMSHDVHPHTHQKTILLDSEYNQYRQVSDTATIAKDPNMIGVFDQHFYDIDPPEPSIVCSPSKMNKSSISKLKKSNMIVKPLTISSWNDVPCDMNIASI